MPHTLILDELFAIPRQYNFTPSSAGDKIVFISTITGKPEFWLYQNGTTEMISHGEVSPSHPDLAETMCWSKEEKGFYFYKDLDAGNKGIIDIWYFDIHSQQAHNITDSTSMTFILCESPDDSKIAFYSNRKGTFQLYILDKQTGLIDQITTGPTSVQPFNAAWLPDNKSIIYTVLYLQKSSESDIYLVNIKTKKSKLLFSQSTTSKEKIRGISNSGNMIAIQSDYFGYDRVGIYNLKTNSVVWLGNSGLDESFCCFSHKEDFIISRRISGAFTELVKYSIATGKETILNCPKGYLRCNYVNKEDSKLFILHENSIHPQRLLIYNLENDSYVEIIPSETGKYNSTQHFYPCQSVSFTSTKQTSIHSLLYTPKTLDKQYPVIIMTHGGPTSQFFDTFYKDVQFLVDNDYVLLLVNVRGSTGYGKAFRDCCIMDWGGKDLEDIKYAVKYLQSLPYVSKKNIGITGESYGGYLTYLAMCKLPNLFKAGSGIGGVSSIKLLYEKSKEHYPPLSLTIERQMGDPNDPKIQQLWEERSPTNFVSKVTGKIQIIHSIDDSATTIEQARYLKEQLLKHNKQENIDFEYLELASGGHGTFEKDFNVVINSKRFEFFNRYLKS